MDNAWIQTMINDESNKYKNINVVTLFKKGKIPERKLKNALIHIAPDANRDDILLVLDNTVWGSNKEGLVFTDSRIYWNTTFVEKSKGSMSYDEINEVSVVKHALILNQTSINLVVSDEGKAIVKELLQTMIGEIKKRKIEQEQKSKAPVKEVHVERQQCYNETDSPMPSDIKRLTGSEEDTEQILQDMRDARAGLTKQCPGCGGLVHYVAKAGGWWCSRCQGMISGNYLLTSRKDIEKLAAICYNIAMRRLKMGEHDEAIVSLQYLVYIYDAIEKLDLKAGILMNMGIVYREKGDYENAIRVLQEAHTIHVKIGDREGTAIDLNQMGLACTDKSDNDVAISCYNKSLAIWEALGDSEEVAATLLNIGANYVSQREYDRALAYFQRAQTIAEEFDYKRLLPLIYEGFTVVCIEDKLFDQALEFCERALEIDEELNDKQGIAARLTDLGMIYYARHDFGAGLINLEKALALRVRMGLDTTDTLNGIRLCREGLRKRNY